MKKEIIKELTKMKPDLKKFSISDKEIWALGNKLADVDSPLFVNGYRKLVELAFDNSLTDRSLCLRENRFRRNFNRLFSTLKYQEGCGIWKVQNNRWTSKFIGYLFARDLEEAKKLAKMVYPANVVETSPMGILYSSDLSFSLEEMTDDPSRIIGWQIKEIESINKQIEQSLSLAKSCTNKAQRLCDRKELLKNVINIFKN